MKVDKVVKGRTSTNRLILTTQPPITQELAQHISKLAPQANLEGVIIQCQGAELVVDIDSLSRITPQMHTRINQMLV